MELEGLRESTARLDKELALFGATEDDEDSGLVRQAAVASSGGDSWYLDTAREEEDFRDALLLFVDQGPGPWIEACGRASERWRSASQRLAKRIAKYDEDDLVSTEAATAQAAADAYRLERETWSLLKLLHEAGLLVGDDDDDDVTVEIVELDTAKEAGDRDAAATPAARRRRVALHWLERGAEERIHSVLDEDDDRGTLGDAVEGVLAVAARDPAFLLSDDFSAGDQAQAAAKMAAGVEAEHDVARATWSLCRAGRWDDAAALDDTVGAHWRAAATRGRGLPGYTEDGIETGNAQRELWRLCCAARAKAARETAEALKRNQRHIEDNLARSRPRWDKAKVASAAADAVECARRAAFYDAARHAALAADLPQLKAVLPMLTDASSHVAFEDAAWAHLICLDDAAARDACIRDAHLAKKTGVLVAPSFELLLDHFSNTTRMSLTAASTSAGLAAILDHVLDTDDAPDDDVFSSKPTRFAQSKLACLGLAGVPGIVDPASVLGKAATPPNEDENNNNNNPENGGDTEEEYPRRLGRLCALLGVAWKLLARQDQDDAAVVDAWLGDYASRLANLGLAPLSAAYAARLDDPAERISRCASCFATATTTADRIACVKAADVAFRNAADCAEIARLAAARCIQKLHEDLDDDDLDDDDDGATVLEEEDQNRVLLSERDGASLRALEWLSPFGPGAWSPCRDGVDLLRQANLLFRRWYFEDVDRTDLPSRLLYLDGRHKRTVAAATALPKYVPPAALDSALDLARRGDEKAAKALHEYASWRTWVRALKRLATWRRALTRLKSQPPAMSHALPSRQTHKKKRRLTTTDAAPLFTGGDDQDDAAAALAMAADRAKVALELVARFPGIGRVNRAKWGPAMPSFDDPDDDDDLAWRLDALTATLARQQLRFDAGWLDLHNDDDDDDKATTSELRRRALPPILEALVHLCKDTGDAIAGHRGGVSTDATAWYAAGMDVPRLVADPDAGLLPDVLSQDDAARLLDRVSACAVELVRRTPTTALRPSSGPDSLGCDLDWLALLQSSNPQSS